MEESGLRELLRELKIEELVWIIYIGIIILSFYANYFERKYFIFNDHISKNRYRQILIFIFSVLVVVYFYFLKDAYEGLKELKRSDTYKKKVLTFLSYIASLLIVISGLIFLYIAISDENVDIEIAFN